MEINLLAIQSSLKPLIDRANANQEVVSRREGEVNIRLLSLSFGSIFEVQVFSNILYGGSKTWADKHLEIVIHKVANEIEYLIKEEMRYPIKNPLDIE